MNEPVVVTPQTGKPFPATLIETRANLRLHEAEGKVRYAAVDGGTAEAWLPMNQIRRLPATPGAEGAA